MVKKKYYRTTEIDKKNADYNLLLGQRSNGKSYAVKEKVLIKAYKTKKPTFIYMRRYQIDVKTSDVESYFGDAPIYSITNGEYSIISCYRGHIYFANIDEEGKITRGIEAGRVVYLSGFHHFKSQTFPDCEDVIFEEFVTDGMYIDNEPNILQNFISTIARDRNIKVWMIGNTISRVCPYFEEWCLKNIPRQKPGTIDIYEFKRYDEVNDLEITTKVAVEYCESTGSISSLFFGKIADSITGGQWETKDMPKLPGKESDFEVVYELLFSDKGFRFIMQLLVDANTGGQFIYVYPFTGKRNVLRKITTVFSPDPFTTTEFNGNIRAEVKMRELLYSGKICYSDNLTGCDFENVLMNRKGAL